MKKTLIIAAALITSISAVKAQLITGSLGVEDFGTGAGYTSSSLTLGNLNIVNSSEQGTFAALVPKLSDVTVDTTTLSGLSTSAKAEDITDFFVFSSPDFLTASGTSPENRFDFTLTSITEVSHSSLSATFTGTGTLIDTDGVYSDTASTFTLTFAGASEYSFTLAGAPVPEPTTWAAGALMLLPMSVGALRALRKKQTA